MLADPKSSRHKTGIGSIGALHGFCHQQEQMAHSTTFIVLQEDYYQALVYVVLVVRFFLCPYK